MASTSDIRKGLCIDLNKDLYFVVDFQHVKPGKGNAFVRTKLRNVKNGRVLEHTFSAGHSITTARIERRPYQFLYKEESGYTMMHNETYEQITVPEFMIERPEYIKDGMSVELVVHAENETVLACDLPQFVELQITYTEPGVKGDTVTNAFKPAELDGGGRVMVPLFVNQGDLIKIDTRANEYVERVKK